MASKIKSVYICSECGYESPKWYGKCPSCGEWNTMNIINKAKKTGNYSEVKKLGLENFKRDTMWVAVLDTIYPKGFNPDSMRYIPFGGGAQFEMAIKNDTAKSGAPFCLLEVKTPAE